MTNITRKFRNAFFSSSASFVPRESPMPMIGPISGEISIAPMMTAVELTFRPTEAMMIEKARIHTFGPRNQIPLRICSAAASVSMSFRMSARRLR